MGEEPSQQPPDWWNIKGPCRPHIFWSSSTAVALRATRDEVSPGTVMPASKVSGVAFMGVLLNKVAYVPKVRRREVTFPGKVTSRRRTLGKSAGGFDEIAPSLREGSTKTPYC